MQSYNFEVLFKSKSHVELFKEENPHITRRIKHFQNLQTSNCETYYLISFVSKRTEKPMREAFQNYSDSVAISFIDLRVNHGKTKNT